MSFEAWFVLLAVGGWTVVMVWAIYASQKQRQKRRDDAHIRKLLDKHNNSP